MNIAKVKGNKLYFLPSGDLIKVLSINQKQNRVIFYNYSSYENDYMELELAEKIFQPGWRIGEVARMFDRKPDTIRRYERAGLLQRPQKFSLDPDSKVQIRVYTTSDIVRLVEFFEKRNPPGRPAKSKRRSFVNKKDIMRHLQARFKKSDIRL